MITNQVTRAVFELIGDPTDTGYALPSPNGLIPVYLNKDGTTKYPQIRISPFISKNDVMYQKHIDDNERMYRHWEAGIFQVDIYTKDLILAQDIYDLIKLRIFDFFNLQTVIFNYNNDFIEIDDYTYANKAYALLDDDMFKDVYGIRIDDVIIDKVKSLDDLRMDTFYVDDEFLYIKTQNNLKHMEIKMLLQGRLFHNGCAYSDIGLHDYQVSKERNLSSLEDNEVERISFDLEVLFSKKINREILPTLNKVFLKSQVK